MEALLYLSAALVNYNNYLVRKYRSRLELAIAVLRIEFRTLRFVAALLPNDVVNVSNDHR